MFSKLMVIQGIVLYFIFICLFCSGDDLYLDYQTKVVKHYLNTKKNTREHRVCSTSKEKLFRLCSRALFYLRMTKMEYKTTLYVNNKIFNTNKKACKTVLVKVPPQYGFSKELVNQIVVTCYARGPIDESPDTNPEDYPFYEKIVVYPYMNEELMIFEQTENRNEFILIDWMKGIYWQCVWYKGDRSFNIPVPVRKDLSVSTEIINKENIVTNNRGKYDVVQKVCILSYGRQTYSDKFIVDTEIKNLKPKPECKIVLFPNGEINVKTYSCAGFLANTDPPVQTEEYRLTPGSGKHDVVLVVYNNETNIYEAVEVIDNIHRSYIDFMFPPR